ncbi:hypothetical protein MesoLj113a_57820 [Mesorhizobium sp. 113-1-2]|nr:hypothetical protein MesoLj113a_57820 [Mesorhizobium sp. 113-1-2]
MVAKTMRSANRSSFPRATPTPFKMDVSFIGGIAKANLEEQFSNWDSMTTNIKDFINQK